MPKSFFDLAEMERPGSLTESERGSLEEWLKIYVKSLNKSKSYKEAAANWEGSLIFGFKKPDKSHLGIYLDLFHGQCRGASLIDDETEYLEKTANPMTKLILSGPLEIWKKEIAKAKPNIMGALMANKLKLQGDMAIIMRYTKAAAILGYYFVKTKLDD